MEDFVLKWSYVGVVRAYTKIDSIFFIVFHGIICSGGYDNLKQEEFSYTMQYKISSNFFFSITYKRPCKIWDFIMVTALRTF